MITEQRKAIFKSCISVSHGMDQKTYMKGQAPVMGLINYLCFIIQPSVCHNTFGGLTFLVAANNRVAIKAEATTGYL